MKTRLVLLIMFAFCVALIFFSYLAKDSTQLTAGRKTGAGNPRFGSETAESVEEVQLAERIVHFDLKGAPPRVEYLKEVFALISRAGATGVLLEYEDMFPYNGTLSLLRSGYAYTNQDIVDLLAAAKQYNLMIIPLIQTFGHMEWVMKHQQFEELREIKRYPQVICPSNPESLTLIQSIIDQVMALHPDIDTFHIGADEAYGVGRECGRCSERIKKDESKYPLMLEHMAKVAGYLRKQHAIKRVMAWHDMFKDADEVILAKYQVDRLIEPVIWCYDPNIGKEETRLIPDDLFQRFSGVFSKMWIGSAFKGANGPAQPFIDIKRYLRNHINWLKLLGSLASRERGRFSGIIMTGWQRFDHFATLCELLPESIPSLVMDLLLLKDGMFRKGFVGRVEDFMECPELHLNDTTVQRKLQVLRKNATHSGATVRDVPYVLFNTAACTFPGSNIHVEIQQLKLLHVRFDLLETPDWKVGWLTDYNTKHQYGSVYRAEQYVNTSQALSEDFVKIGLKLRPLLMEVYFADTVNEWLFSNIQTYINAMKKTSQSVLPIAKTVEFRNRPLDTDKMDF